MTLRTFLLEKTNTCDLCIIREDGWITGAVWIDNEDLWTRCLDSRVSEMQVKRDIWGAIPVLTARCEKLFVPCHYIDV